MSVKRLLTEMDSYEISAWQAFLMADAQASADRNARAKQDAQYDEA